MIDRIRREPVLVAASGSLAANVAQILALPIPNWAHVLLIIVLILGPALGARQKVSPNDNPNP